MCRWAVIIINLIVFSSAKLSPKFEGDTNDINQPQSNEVHWPIFDNAPGSEKDKLWVLVLNDEKLDSLILRRGTKQNEEDFNFYAEPSIKEYKNRQNRVVKKDASRLINRDDLDRQKPVKKKDIFKYLNKYSLYSRTEPDTNLSDSHEADEPSIALYFKGQFTSLIVSIGMRQWHYFISPTTASWFPSWLYEDHTAEAIADTVKVPDDVRDKLYSALSRVLQIVLRYPL